MVGAGEAGSMLAREMQRHPETGLHPIGFLDDDPSKHRRTVSAVPILAGLDALEHVLEHVVAMRSAATIDAAPAASTTWRASAKPKRVQLRR